MPARATILTGQHVRTHGVTSNGIPLPADHPSAAHELKRHGYKTALIGKAHFEPHAARDFFENVAAGQGSFGPHRGFDHMELAGHTGRAGRSLFQYPKWLAERDGYLVTAYEPTNRYAGTEGELYSLDDDPHQWRNLWDEPGFAAIRKELVSDLRTHLPEGRSEPLAKVAPV